METSLMVNHLNTLWMESEGREREIHWLPRQLKLSPHSYNNNNNNNNTEGSDSSSSSSLVWSGRRILVDTPVNNNTINNKDNNKDASSTSYVSGLEWNDQLVQGEWRAVLHSTTEQMSYSASTTTNNNNDNKKFNDSDSSSPSSYSSEVAVSVVPPHRYSPSRVKLSRAEVTLRHPLDLTESNRDVRWLLNPPSEGLDILSRYALSKGKDNKKNNKKKTVYDLDLLLDIAKKEIQSGRNNKALPSVLVELKQRLKVLYFMVPSSVSKRLVRFPSSSTGAAAPFLWRDLTRESLPWYLIAKVNEIYVTCEKEDTVQKREEKRRILLRLLRQESKHWIFRIKYNYASFFDFLSLFFIEMGNASLSATYHHLCYSSSVEEVKTGGGGHHRRDGNDNDNYLATAVRVLLKPPSPSFYSTTTMPPPPHRNTHHYLCTSYNPNELILYRLNRLLYCERNYHFSLYMETLLLTAQHNILLQLEEIITTKRVEEKKEKERRSVSAAADNTDHNNNKNPSNGDDDNDEEKQTDTPFTREDEEMVCDAIPFLLAPETAAVLLTAVGLQFYGFMGKKMRQYTETLETSPPYSPYKWRDEFLKELQSVFFPSSSSAPPLEIYFATFTQEAVQDSVRPATASVKTPYGSLPFYFKHLFHEAFFEPLDVSSDGLPHHDGEEEWDSPAALLVGRSQRGALHRYPSTTTDGFFFLHCQAHTNHTVALDYRVPPLRVRYYKLRWESVLTVLERRYWAETALQYPSLLQTPWYPFPEENIQEKGGGKETPLCLTPSGALPYGLTALYKPAPDWNCTFGLRYHNLIAFMSLHQPIPSRKGDNGEETARRQSVPVLHQHGLINRIDRTTSGLLLMHDYRRTEKENVSSCSLHQSIVATVVQRKVSKDYIALVHHLPCYSHHSRKSSSPSPSPPHYYHRVQRSRLLRSEVHYLSPKGEINQPVHAEGTTWTGLHPPQPSLQLFQQPRDMRPARTAYTVLQYFPHSRVYLVKVTLQSGRRHQIRQHFASIGHPLLGDDRYHPLVGRYDPSTTATVNKDAYYWANRPHRAALHASRLVVVGGDTPQEGTAAVLGKSVVYCEPPPDMQEVLKVVVGL